MPYHFHQNSSELGMKILRVYGVCCGCFIFLRYFLYHPPPPPPPHLPPLLHPPTTDSISEYCNVCTMSFSFCMLCFGRHFMTTFSHYFHTFMCTHKHLIVLFKSPLPWRTTLILRISMNVSQMVGLCLIIFCILIGYPILQFLARFLLVHVTGLPTALMK